MSQRGRRAGAIHDLLPAGIEGSEAPAGLALDVRGCWKQFAQSARSRLGALLLFGALLACTACGSSTRALRTVGPGRAAQATLNTNESTRPAPALRSPVACGSRTADSTAAAIVTVVDKGTWAVQFRHNDHGARQALDAMYALSRGVPLWLVDGRPTAQASVLLLTLEGAQRYGLEPRDYDVSHLSVLASSLESARGGSGEPGRCAMAAARFDVDLSAAALKLVSDLHYGRIDPRAAGFELGKPRPDDLDLGGTVRELARTADLQRALSAIEPQFSHYRLLEQVLARYRGLDARDPARASEMRKIDLTLERWRWLPAFQTPPIIVNIPEFRLFAFRTTADRAAEILQMDVIVGRTFPRTRTPVFVADIESVLFRPYWDVPRSITVREMLPKIRAKPGYLTAEHLEIVRGRNDATAVPLPPTQENLEALAAGALRLRQRPGPDNALGLIKFDLPNPYQIYLHSTPARQLFLKPRRAFSHGCIRVSDPVALAALVLRATPGDWTPGKIEAAMNGTETRRVTLAHPIHVMILYGTVLAKEDGEVLFFKDLYGQDRRLERLLGLAPVSVAVATR